jgi:hypothetical protein
MAGCFVLHCAAGSTCTVVVYFPCVGFFLTALHVTYNDLFWQAALTLLALSNQLTTVCRICCSLACPLTCHPASLPGRLPAHFLPACMSLVCPLTCPLACRLSARLLSHLPACLPAALVRLDFSCPLARPLVL